MPYVTSAMSDVTEATSFPFEAYEDALVKAAELADAGADSVSVTDIESGEVLTGGELLAAIESLANGNA